MGKKVKPLTKIEKKQIEKLIQERKSVSFFKSYCKKIGLDTDKPSNSIHITEQGVLVMKYRNSYSYHFIDFAYKIKQLQKTIDNEN